MAKDLRQTLVELQAFKPTAPEDRIIFGERDIGISPKALTIWFLKLYRDLGFKGASSHSGRRTFITKAAKRCIEGGGSLSDVQQLAGHSTHRPAVVRAGLRLNNPHAGRLDRATLSASCRS